MNKSNLLAPEKYNIVSEIEKYASEDHKKAIIYKDNEHENISVSYKELISNANKVGNVFLNHGLKKGDKVFVEGRIKTRKWDDNGQTRYTTEIVANSIEFLTPKIDNEQRQAMQNDQNKVQQSQQNTTVVEPPFIDEGEDDLPF